MRDDGQSDFLLAQISAHDEAKVFVPIYLVRHQRNNRKYPFQVECIVSLHNY